MSADDGVRLRREGDAAYITLDRPAVKNALDRTTWAALGRAVAAAHASPAGGDLKSMPERLALPYDERRAQLTADAQVIRAIVGLRRPTITLINNPTINTNLTIALACDVRLASARSRLSFAFRKVGLAADF